MNEVSNAVPEFSPRMGDIYTMMAICGVAFLVLLLLAIRLNKIDNPDPRKKVLLPMLCYFMALLALMGFLGSFWSVFKYPSVDITPSALIIDGETFPLPKQHQVRLESVAGSGINNVSARILLIQTRDRRTWAFPDDRYPVNEMMGKLRK